MNKLERKVPIKNVLYMFSYIWDKAENIDSEYLDNNDDFDSINILAQLFIENMKTIKKRGLYKEYSENEEEIRGIKGKINFKESINNMSFRNAKTVCIYDELEENNLINQIIKSTALKLYNSIDINNENKKNLNSILLYFNKVKTIDIKENLFYISFNRTSYYTYNMIMICKLINESTMLSEEKGKYKFINILDDDERMNKIFERFVYKFYCKEQKEYKVYFQKTKEWKLYSGDRSIFPKMSLDTVLEDKSKTIIIDTKYYSDFLKNRYHEKDGGKKLISDNLYQMYAYMNNYGTDKDLLGILLYPVPYSLNDISEEYEIDTLGKEKINKSLLKIKTVDLSKDWKDIKKELLNIVKSDTKG